MHSIEEYINLVNKTIAEIEYPKQPERLYNPIAYTMALGGKRLRPVLTLLTCEALGGDIAKAIDVAVGIELFHNFTLLHDVGRIALDRHASRQLIDEALDFLREG